MQALAAHLAPALVPGPEPHHDEPPAVQERRRLLVLAVLAVGAGVIATAFHTDQGSTEFYVLTLALAGVWGVGAVISGPLHWGSRDGRRVVAAPLTLAAITFGVFVAGDLIFQQVPFLHRQVLELLDRADSNGTPIALAVALSNAVAEEAFFRGALYSAFGRHNPLLWTTLINLAVSLSGGNLSLGVAAVVMGTIFGLERRATRGVLAPMVTHVAWSTLMVLLLPR